MSSRTRTIWLLGGFAALAVALLVAYAAAQSVVKGRIAEALGPNSETREIRVGLWGLELDGLRIRAPSGWPTEDALRAEQLTIAPRLLTLFSGDAVRIRTIDIEAPYLSVLRGRKGGLEALPGLFGRDAPAEAEPEGEPVHIELGEIEIEAGVLELFDATVAKPPLRIRIEQIAATLEDLSVPDLAGKSRFKLDGVVKGKAHDGRVHLEGWGEVGTRESSVSIELRGVDLVPLQPYLVRPGETSVQRGSVDLDMQSDVTGARLDARGRITISDLELASSPGLRNTFLGVSNSVVLAGMQDRGGKLTLDFTLSGDVDQPDFSLNEALGTKLAYSLAETLGVSIGGLVEGVGALGAKGGQAAGEAAKGVGGAIMDLFDGEPERK
jgi:hypothetical protein